MENAPAVLDQWYWLAVMLVLIWGYLSTLLTGLVSFMIFGPQSQTLTAVKFQAFSIIANAAVALVLLIQLPPYFRALAA